VSELAQKTCTPCQGGIPRLTLAEAEALLPQVPGWQLTCNHTKLQREWKFKNFTKAFAFVSKLHDLAEEQFHHPDIEFGWGYVRVVFFTHKILGLHESDFICAARVNQLMG
jgi:4a-hydroxytetrahydrobiopterin dehydratase